MGAHTALVHEAGTTVTPTQQLANASTRVQARVDLAVWALTHGTAFPHRILLIVKVPGLPPQSGETEAGTQSSKTCPGIRSHRVKLPLQQTERG